VLIAVSIAGCGGSELRVAVGPTGWMYVALDENGMFSPTGATDIYALSPDGSTLKTLTATPGVKEEWLTASPDGKAVAYIAIVPITSGETQTGPYKLRLKNLEEEATHTLYESEQLIVSPRFSPTGAYLSFAVMSKADASKYAVYFYDFQAQKVTPLIEEIALPGMGSEIAWENTGDALIVLDYKAEKNSEGQETARGEVLHLTLDGKKEALLGGFIQTTGLNQEKVVASEGLVPFAFAAWSPDGRALVFTGIEYRHEENQTPQLMGGLYQLNLKDRSVGRVYSVPLSEITDNVSLFPVFSPTGAYLAFNTISYENVPKTGFYAKLHPEQAPKANLFIYDFAQAKIIKRIEGIDPWVPPFWGDEERFGYAALSGFGGAPLGGSGTSTSIGIGPSLAEPEHPEIRFLWMEELQSGHRINLSERLRMMIIQENLSRRVTQLESAALQKHDAQKALEEKVETQLTELSQKAQTLEEASKAISDLKSQLETKSQEIQSMKTEMSTAKADLESQRLTSRNSYTGFFIFVMILIAGLGIWIWWRTRQS
jgi:hypothetical protein